MVLAALSVPTNSALKDRAAGEMVSGDVPLPERLMTCGLLNAESYTWSWPSRTPPMVGSKLTEILQDAPAASAAGSVPQVVAVCSKSPLNWKVSRVSGVVAEFLMVTVLKALVVPTGAEKLVIETGVIVTGALPEPVRVRVCGLFDAPSIMLRAAVLAPEAVGVKVTESVHLELAGTEEGTVGQELITPKSPLLVPAIETPEMFSGIFCSLVTVTVWPPLVVPTNCAAKVNFSEAGKIATGAIPFPASVTVCGLLLAS